MASETFNIDLLSPGSGFDIDLQKTTTFPKTEIYSLGGTFVSIPPVGAIEAVIEAYGNGGNGGLPSGLITAGGGAGAQYAKLTVSDFTGIESFRLTVAKTHTGQGSYGNDSIIEKFDGTSTYTVICRAKGGQDANNSTGGIGATTNGLGDIVNAGGDGDSGDTSEFEDFIGAGGGGAGPDGDGGDSSPTSGIGGIGGGGVAGSGGSADGGYGDDYGGGGAGTSGTTSAPGGKGYIKITYNTTPVESGTKHFFAL